ncbi:MAG: 2-C-methyl-D-erythritol 4-phosphate cytidylyltransferase [Gaiellaceae bacterium]
MSNVWAILVAAGRGERLAADRPKAFVAFNGRPLLAESLSRLDSSEYIDNVVVVAPIGWEEPAILCAEEESASKVVACVCGGDTRADSVRAGVAEISEDAGVILIHDAARPLVTDEVVSRVLGALEEDGIDGAVPGLAIPDTIKQTADGLVERTIPRDGLFAVQTPQGFRAEVFRRALAESGDSPTDCAGLVEAAGGRVRVVAGDRCLTKVTTPADLAFVEELARR